MSLPVNRFPNKLAPIVKIENQAKEQKGGFLGILLSNDTPRNPPFCSFA